MFGVFGETLLCCGITEIKLVVKKEKKQTDTAFSAFGLTTTLDLSLLHCAL